MSYKRSMTSMIKKRFETFAIENGFHFHKPTILARINEHVIHIINFDVLTLGFNCSIAIQPLYVPLDNIALNCGNRLNDFRVNIPGNWGYGTSVEQDLDEVEALLRENAVPWFDEVGNPQGLVKFIEEEERVNLLTVGFAPFFRTLYLGLSLIFVDKVDEGIHLLGEIFKHPQEYNSIWFTKWKETIDPLFKPGINVDEARTILSEFSQYSRGKIGMK